MIGGSLVKGVLMVALGFLTAAIGLDVVNGRERFTFGSIDLSAGIELLAVVIGLFGVTEVLSNVERIVKSTVVTDRIRGLWPTLADWRASWRPMLRGSGLGFFLGLVPGGGPVTASFMSYALEKRISAHPERFGKGAIEGVAGPESANNAAVAGSIIPVLSLGIPGNPVTALLRGALVIQGMLPGPRIPYRVLFPIVLLLSVVGTYSANKNVFDLWVMLGFGLLGYVLHKLEYDLAPFVIALVLAPLLEQSLRQSLAMSPDGAMIFLQRPGTALMLTACAVLVALMFRRAKKS
jgi:putative tricarboxylic transport membrane protein